MYCAQHSLFSFSEAFSGFHRPVLRLVSPVKAINTGTCADYNGRSWAPYLDTSLFGDLRKTFRLCHTPLTFLLLLLMLVIVGYSYLTVAVVYVQFEMPFLRGRCSDQSEKSPNPLVLVSVSNETVWCL